MKKSLVCVFADFSKAFDTVDHSILLGKLFDYGIRGPALNFVKSYLSDRKQYISINGCVSQNFEIHYGVPQGSVLGPLFFNIYANEISHLPLNVDVIQYADDTVLISSDTNINNLVLRINNALDLFASWCNFNKLALNISKTKYLLFSPKKLQADPILSIKGEALDRVAYYKYLGITIDEKLNYEIHIKSVITKLSRLCGISFKLGEYFSLSAAKNFYFALVQSILSYNIIFWGASSLSLLESACRKQNLIMRNLFKHHYTIFSCTSKLYSTTNILKLKDIHKLALSNTVYLSLHTNKYPNIKHHLNTLTWNHNHNTRRNHMFMLPQTRVLPDTRCFIFQAVKFYNSLPVRIRNSTSFAMFKNTLCHFLRREY